ncbi:acyl-CoA thioester hydrolase/BAAT C-terminal domain-containing protein [Arenibacter sp. S6351L]|uniref:acyl-CoA thioester hydrolase/BAAT C-terminal domain-containing protein n=1 Tax=Arenibacter sp. S6351L TaxID=2926407 RepID=UPI001FF25B2D|nr:acyl-CoA thioester hydrolase/BAAT C-terminal domain-containing protein [Arenibacter sp. S6351L]MCK0135772.1 palmitoyl-CoA hydrolase [Arenibacter sp. S6351L]
MIKNRKYIIGIGILIFLIVGYFIADSILFSGVRSRHINENGFQANYFVKTDTKKKVSIVLIGGGPWGDYWGQQFASSGYSGLSLPYTQREGLPKLPEEINLEYFEKALVWLKKQPEVDPNKIIVMGASRNAELALVLASIFPESISGVVAYAPSAVSWSNTVLPYNSNELKSSWKYEGVDIPYVPMNKITGNESNKIIMVEYWKKGLQKTDFIEQAAIKVEKINGPVLLFSGRDDQVWPSSIMADMIEKRLEAHSFKYSFQNIKYENAGHLISSNPDDNTSYRTGTINISGKNYEYEFGGNDDGDFKAKQDAKMKLMEFLEKI